MGLFSLFTMRGKMRKFEEEQILNCRRIFSESMDVMASTADIDTFFSRYSVAANAIEEAGRIAGELSPCLNGVTPKEALETLHRDISRILIPCIDRYMDKKTLHLCSLSRGRVSKARAIEVVAETYQEKLPSDCFEHWKWRIQKLVKRMEQLEWEEKQKLNR